MDFKFNLSENIKNTNLIEDIKMGYGQSDKTEFELNFSSIRVENPTVLVVNGKKWTKEKVSSAFFVPKVIDD